MAALAIVVCSLTATARASLTQVSGTSSDTTPSNRFLYSSADGQLNAPAGTAYSGAANTTIMYTLYGASGLRYERVDDLNDAQWLNPTGTPGIAMMATVKFAGSDSQYGYYNPSATGAASANFKSVFSTTGYGYVGAGANVTWSGANSVQLGPNSFLITPANTGSPFEFGLKPTSSGQYFSSNPNSGLTGLTDQGASSSTKNDQMVTFKILDASNNWTGKYVLAWEDVSRSGSGDKDYQDLVLEFQYATPEPSSLAIAGLGALGLIGYGIRRRRGA